MAVLLLRGVLVAAGVVALMGCDTGARKDLPQDNQNLDDADAIVGLSPDGFPNLMHKCFGDLDGIGYWATTDRMVIIIYNDKLCGGEGEPLILSNIPGRSSGEYIGTGG